VPFVADVDDAVPLAGAHLHLVMHLGHEGAHRVDHHGAPRTSGCHDVGCRSVGRQHDRSTLGHLGNVVDEHDTEILETLDDDLVVDDLVVAVHRSLETANHPRQGLDGHLDSGAETAGSGQQHVVDVHGGRITNDPCPKVDG